MASQGVGAEKRFRMSLLLDTYGELLTDKQSTFLRRYYEEDFSFGEIAGEFEVSRQAIFDAVKHGEAQLERYEKVLGLVQAGFDRRGSGAAGSDGGALASAAARLSEGAEGIRACAEALPAAGAETSEAIAEQLSRLGAEIDALAEIVAQEGARQGLHTAAGWPGAARAGVDGEDEDVGDGGDEPGGESGGSPAGGGPGAARRFLGGKPEVD